MLQQSLPHGFDQFLIVVVQLTLQARLLQTGTDLHLNIANQGSSLDFALGDRQRDMATQISAGKLLA